MSQQRSGGSAGSPGFHMNVKVGYIFHITEREVGFEICLHFLTKQNHKGIVEGDF